VSAAIVRNGKIIGMGTCSDKVTTLQHRFAKNEFADQEHAEICAIRNTVKRLRSNDLSDCSIVVVRRKYTNTNKTDMVDGNAKPCSGCRRAIKRHGIKEVVYTMDDGIIIEN
jgi:tRNA(Arg) A34 adenosine deaminase TadA